MSVVYGTLICYILFMWWQLICIIIFSFAGFNTAFASCPSQSTSSHLVITMEGLYGGVNGRSHRLASSYQSAGGYQIASFAHLDSLAARSSQSLIASCASAWKNRFGSKARITLIGHSLGGGDVVKVARALGSRGMRVNDMIVMDGREGNEVACGDSRFGRRYSKPRNVSRVTNFYQCGFMPGNKFRKGKGVNNIKIPAALGQHVNMPSHGTVRSVVGGILTRGKVANKRPVATKRPPRRRRPVLAGLFKKPVFGFRSRGKNPWRNHHKANRKAKCPKMGRWVECSWAEASQQSYGNNFVGR